MGLWQLLLIDWCTATSWWLRCCVLIWIISHLKKRISAIPHTPESRRTWIKNLHVREGVNESTDVRILTSWWCVSVCVCVCIHAGVSLWICWSIMCNNRRVSCQNILSLRLTSHSDCFYKKLQFSFLSLNRLCLRGMVSPKTDEQANSEWMITKAHKAL